MPQSPPVEPLEAQTPSSNSSAPKRGSGRGWLVVSLLLVLLLLAILPPLLSISRYHHRIAASMSQVLGRPVHLDHVALNLLPFPSLTLSNLVIDEVPPFGMEPIVRASSVNARLRLLPLWRHRVEFSRITFTDPSVNLVRLSSGRWNLESVLLQAAHIDAAPTAQRSFGGQPRFPYIEATDARVNLKLDTLKTPFSLTETDFALWLPEPRQWRIRLRGHPVRTDTSATDTGTVQAEVTLQRASALAEVPISLSASWTGAPLGEASRVLTGHDAGLRGGLHLDASLHGTVQQAALQATLILSDLHRVDLVPDRPVLVNLACNAALTHLLHTVQAFRCLWPIDGGTGAALQLTGDVPSLLSPASANLQLAASHIPATTALHWLRATTSQLPPTLRAAGELSAQATYTGRQAPALASLRLSDLVLSADTQEPDPVRFGPILLTATLAPPQPGSAGLSPELSLTPTTIHLGPVSPSADASPDASPTDSPSPEPAPIASEELTLSLGADMEGLSARLAGVASPARVATLAAILPPLGAGLRQALPPDPTGRPVALDLTARHPWGAPQHWTELSAGPSPSPPQNTPKHHHPQ